MKTVFDFLKKKINGFIEGLTKKEEEKEPKIEEKTPEKEAPVIEKPEPPAAEIVPTEKKEKKQAPRTEKEQPKKPESEKKREPARIGSEPPKIQKPESKEPEAVKTGAPKAPETKAAPKIVEKSPEPPKPAPKATETKIIERIPDAHEVPKAPKTSPKAVPEAHRIQEPNPPIKTSVQEKPRIHLTPISAIKSFITSEVEIKEGDVKEMLESLELELLESDVDMSVAQAITEELSSRLIGARIKKSELHQFIARSIKQTLTEVLTNKDSFDLLERLDATEKPMKIMFIGINGAGKTTTIAKVAKLMMDGKRKVVFAAADTFRAAAIEQIEVHAGRLGVKTIKRDYGSDPTSVAYDAVGYAKAHGIDAVLIDTAGRQDTNISLLNEIKKMSRVIGPDLKIYIGESISGNAIVEQISSFNREVGIDAVILTKMDCDPKGGTMLSISKATGIPIIYVGTGQDYNDLERFDPERIAERIVG